MAAAPPGAMAGSAGGAAAGGQFTNSSGSGNSNNAISGHRLFDVIDVAREGALAAALEERHRMQHLVRQLDAERVLAERRAASLEQKLTRLKRLLALANLFWAERSCKFGEHPTELSLLFGSVTSWLLRQTTGNIDRRCDGGEESDDGEPYLAVFASGAASSDGAPGLGRHPIEIAEASAFSSIQRQFHRGALRVVLADLRRSQAKLSRARTRGDSLEHALEHFLVAFSEEAEKRRQLVDDALSEWATLAVAGTRRAAALALTAQRAAADATVTAQRESLREAADTATRDAADLHAATQIIRDQRAELLRLRHQHQQRWEQCAAKVAATLVVDGIDVAEGES
jgi:hypothetical protein